MVLCHKDLNSKKGSKTPEEAGLKLIREPKEMGVAFVCDILKFNNHVDWTLFNK